MKSLRTILIALFGLVSLAQGKAYVVEGVIKKQGESYEVSYRYSNKPVSIENFVQYLQGIRNGSTVSLSILSAESIPIPVIQDILTGASKNPLIEILDIRLSIVGKLELESREKHVAEKGGADKPASQTKAKSGDSQNPKPEPDRSFR